MRSSFKFYDHFIEVSFKGNTSVDQRIRQIKKIRAIVEHSRKMNLIIKMHKGSGIFDHKELSEVMESIHREDLSLRNRSLFIKVAICLIDFSLEEFELHSRMLKAKDINNIAFFEDTKTAIRWLELRTTLSDVTAFFQPIVNLETGHIVGYEALARKVVEGEIVPIKRWLPQLLNEKDGPILLTEKMISVAKGHAKKLSDGQYISVNFEVENINKQDLHRILSPCAKSTMEKRLVIELCESGKLSLESLNDISSSPIPNIRLSLDDVGAGASRLLAIAGLKPWSIKLDKAVIDNLSHDDVFSFVSYFSKWANESNIKIVAEGIETRDMADLCIKAGIGYGQGFFFYRPAPKLV